MNFDILCILMIILTATGGITLQYLATNYYEEGIVDCYDEYKNVIVGLECKGEIPSEPWVKPVSITIVLVMMIITILIIIEMFSCILRW